MPATPPLALLAGNADRPTQLNTPYGITTDGAGNVYVADSRNRTVRKVTPAGVVSTLVGVAGQTGSTLGALPGLINAPYGVAVSGNSLYIATLYGVIVLRDLP